MRISWTNSSFLIGLLLLALTSNAQTLVRPGDLLMEEPPPSALDDEVFLKFFKKLRAYQPDEVLEECPSSDLSTNLKRVLNGYAYHQKGQYRESVKLFSQVDLSDPDLLGFLNYRVAELLKTGEQLKDFRTFDTEHFSIRFHGGKDEVLKYFIPEILEAAYDQYTRIFDYHQDEKIIVEIMPDHKLFSYASALTKSQIETTGTVALCVENRLVMLTPRRVAMGYYWPDVIAHEFVHYILTKLSRDHAPLWLQEGVAKYFERRWAVEPGPGTGPGSEHRALDPSLESRLALALETGEYVTIEQMHPSFAALPTASLARLAYAQTTSMVDYIAQTKGEWVIRDMVRELAQNDEFEPLLEQKMDVSFQDFQDAWKAWAAEQGYQKRDTHAPEGVALLEQDASNDPMNEMNQGDDVPKKHTRLGDLLLERHRFGPALKEYRKATVDTERYSRQLILRLLTCFENLGFATDAITLIDEQVSQIEHDSTMLKYKAKALMLKQDFVAAELLLDRAVHINPYDPNIHLQFKELFELTQRLSEIQEVEEILQILSKPNTVTKDKESKS